MATKTVICIDRDEVDGVLYDITYNGYKFETMVIDCIETDDNGKHYSNFYLAIPNWHTALKITEPSDWIYIADKLSELITIDGAAMAIAKVLAKVYGATGDDEVKTAVTMEVE